MKGGLDFSRYGIDTSLTWFYTKFRDKISMYYLPGGSQTWKNLGEATISGFETELSYDLGEPFAWDWELRPYINLTYLTQYEDNKTSEDLQYISAKTLAAGIVTGNGAGTYCRLNVIYTGSQNVQDWESRIYPTPEIKMIISASRRTDIPACYSQCFVNRLHEGYVLVRNPMNFMKVSRIILFPETTECIVFWTKNPRQMLEKLPIIDNLGYHYYFLFTLTPYDQSLEPNVPGREERIETFRTLADQIGKEKVIWRYDPIFFTNRMPSSYSRFIFIYIVRNYFVLFC